MNENVQNADAILTVTPPTATTAATEKPDSAERKPSDGICNWCRNAPGDIYCDEWPICFNCIEELIEYENAWGILDEAKKPAKYQMKKDLYDSKH